MEIRRAHAAEYPSVGALTVDVYVGDGFIEEGSDYIEELRSVESRATSAELLVALDDSDVLGAVTYCPVGSPWRETAEDDEGEFRMLVVAPSARGRGVGRALVAACIERARNSGLNGLRMSSMPTMTSAHRVYERLGFTRLPEADWSPTAGVDLLAYGLRFA